MIEIKNVYKSIGNKVIIDNLSLNIKTSDVYGLLGPNVAGKTTLVRQIMGFIKSDTGELKVNGVDAWNNSKIIMEDIGYIPGEIALYNNLTGLQFLNMLKTFKTNCDELFLKKHLDFFEMNSDIDKKIKKMSKG